jgi:hypothetical protein
MDTSEILHELTTVEETLQKWPETWVVFKSRKTQCVGCFLQRFCSLQDVAKTFQFPVHDLIEELENRVNQTQSSQRSIS